MPHGKEIFMPNVNIKLVFSERLNKLCDMLPSYLTTEDIARGCDIPEPTLRSYKSARSLPNYDTLLKMADYFNAPLDYFFGRIDLVEERQYKADMRTLVEKSYEKYLSTNRNQRMPNLVYYEDTPAMKIAPVWPYNLLDMVQNATKIDDERTLNYPLTPEQMEGLDYVINSCLTDRERLCVLSYFKDEFTLDECGRQFGVGRERIRQIVAKAVRKIRHPSRFNIIRYGLVVLETNSQKQQILKLKAELDTEILELNKKIAEVSAKNAVSKDDIMDVLDITEEQVEEARRNVYTTPLIELDLSVRSYNCLTRAGCRSMADVIPKIEDDSIIKVRNLGRRSAKEIANKLLDLGYRSEKCQQYASL